MDFTQKKYEELCGTVRSSKYKCLTLADYLLLNQNKRDGNYIIMRHDIDRTPYRALEIAEIEHKYGISATYYFRFMKGVYIREVIDEILALGHEIGFHYETMDKCKGDFEQAKALFDKEFAEFNSKSRIKTVCAHGNPLTIFDNKDIWKSLKYSDYSLLGEAFFALDFNRFGYFSDSGRTWIKSKSQKMPGKDDVATKFDHIQPKNTDDIIKIIHAKSIPNICILTHCERWTKNSIEFANRYLFDLACSSGKVLISAIRGQNY